MQNTKQYIDFLLAERQDGSLVLIVAEAHSAEVGYIVEFNNGELGRVLKKAWGNERDGEMHDLIAAMVPTYEAESAYWQRWKREEGNVEDTGNP